MHDEHAARGMRHEHDHHHHEHAHEPLPIDQREVTSILVLCKDPLGPMVLDMAINKGNDRIAQVGRAGARSGHAC